MFSLVFVSDGCGFLLNFFLTLKIKILCRKSFSHLNLPFQTNNLSLQVAIKKMKKKYYSWEECINLREVKVTQLAYLLTGSAFY